MDKDNDAKIGDFSSNFIEEIITYTWRECHLSCFHGNHKFISHFSNIYFGNYIKIESLIRQNIIFIGFIIVTDLQMFYSGSILVILT